MRASARSHRRLFIIEVMGRDQGHIAMEVGLACGAEEVLVPEAPYGAARVSGLSDRLRAAWQRGHQSVIIVVAEGVLTTGWGLAQASGAGPAHDLGVALRGRIGGWEARTTVLGHVQRGAWPTPRTRTLAARLGLKAVDTLVRRIDSGRCPPPQLVGVNAQGQTRMTPVSYPMVRESARAISRARREVERLSY